MTYRPQRDRWFQAHVIGCLVVTIEFIVITLITVSIITAITHTIKAIVSLFS